MINYQKFQTSQFSLHVCRHNRYRARDKFHQLYWSTKIFYWLSCSYLAQGQADLARQVLQRAAYLCLKLSRSIKIDSTTPMQVTMVREVGQEIYRAFGRIDLFEAMS